MHIAQNIELCGFDRAVLRIVNIGETRKVIHMATVTGGIDHSVHVEQVTDHHLLVSSQIGRGDAIEYAHPIPSIG